MLYEYAITPDVFRAELYEKRPSLQRDLRRLLRDIADTGGLIADLHKAEWKKHIFQNLLPQLSPQMQSDLKEVFERLHDRNRLVPCPPCEESPACDMDWLLAALDEGKRTPVQGIVLTKPLISRFGLPHPLFMEIAEALDLPHWTERPRTTEIETSVTGYREALTPVLRHARTLDLIDPYMDCTKPRFFSFVELCARFIGKHRPFRTTRLINIHASDIFLKDCPEIEHPYRIEEQLKAWTTRLLPLINADNQLRFRVFLWSDQGVNEDFHDRFFITDQCAFLVGRGFDIRSGNKTTWSLIDETPRRDQLANFTKMSSPFTLLGSVEVPERP